MSRAYQFESIERRFQRAACPTRWQDLVQPPHFQTPNTLNLLVARVDPGYSNLIECT